MNFFSELLSQGFLWKTKEKEMRGRTLSSRLQSRPPLLVASITEGCRLLVHKARKPVSRITRRVQVHDVPRYNQQ